MRQPVSRITFDRRRGFLGVHLQEGALFVDAAWNESADIAWSLLRDAIIAGGITGTAGRELRIEPIVDAQGRLRNLRVCSTSADGGLPVRPFYCDGLPVLWLADLPIDAQAIGDAFRADATGDTSVPHGGAWIDLLQDVPYQVYLRARVATLDRLDDPFLDDPGLDAARGTFRKRVTGEVRIRRAGAPCPPRTSNLQLSVDGSYRSDLNVLYRVELDALTGAPGAPAASVLWDPDAAATVARVVDTAAEHARLIMLDSTAGFDAGFVRFEGAGLGPELYRVTKAPGLEGAAIQITRHRCDRAELSLAAWQPVGTHEDLATDRFAATFVVPPPLQAGDILRDLPEALRLSWTEAKVLAVTAFDPDRNTVSVTLAQATRTTAPLRALSLSGWRATGPAVQAVDGTFAATLEAPPAVERGDVVTALPPSLGTPTTGPWVVLAVVPHAAEPDAAPIASPSRPLIAITFGPAGLVRPLFTLDTARKSTLRAAARAFETTIVVDDRADWTVGTRISIVRKDGATTTAREDRTIIRIERAAPSTMLVRLAQPLSYDHVAGEEDVVPERLIRARRFAGHECRLGIDRVDPARDGIASLANFAHELALPDGLSLHLTTEQADGPPRLVRGDGWHFAARSDGWVETRLFAPVEESPASELALAQLTVTAAGHELIDVRPVPAGVSDDDALGEIAAAATAIAALGEDPATPIAGAIARLADAPRVQPTLLAQLAQLARLDHSRLFASPVSRPWLARLAHAVADVRADTPTRRQLAAIGFAISGLAFAAATVRAQEPRR